ncbi:MAG TPA: HD domain-containing protein, partial [Chitinophagales bacterium]|nr:HD domain-containing protein [Chitinophagales bacterium]
MNKRKIFNDPVYGFISIPYDIVFDIIEHPIFQRLRRIQQLGLSSLVYPGATHSRFHHSLGAMHLMSKSLEVLKSKGNTITEAESEAAVLAILMHDLGHGPFSHALEGVLVENIPHENISLLLMEKLSVEFGEKIEVAIQIFNNTYPKKFLHQLVSGQLDMDRMDYLNRDSFYSGVSEGVIGYDRILNMLDVHEGNIVVEEKGIYSIEQFLIARRLMYW